MARRSPAEKLQHLLKATLAWESLRPTKSFFGLTLQQFKQAIRPSVDVRTEIEDLQQQLRMAIRRRNAADLRSFKILRGVVYAVQADPDEGGNGRLYVALGYVPWRRRGRPRKRVR